MRRAGFKKEEFMKKSIFAVCDLEASYAYNLMEAIDERQGMSFEVQAFTNVESLASTSAKSAACTFWL